MEKFAGDAVMAAFGIPQAHEDDSERAVRAALEILEGVDQLELQARIGVEAGEVVTGAGDSTFATGEALNIAARLQQLAEPGRSCSAPRRTGSRWDGSRSTTSGRSRSAAGTSRSGRGPRRAPPGGLQHVWRSRRSSAATTSSTSSRTHSHAQHGTGGPISSRFTAAGRRQEPPLQRVSRLARRNDCPPWALSPVRREHHVLAARRDGQGCSRHR